jgi:chorismate mutase
MSKTVDKELAAIRKKIDKLDKVLLKTLKERTRLISRVAKIKIKHDLPLYQRARWNAMLVDRISRAEAMKLDPGFIRALFQLIHKESIRLQGLIRNEVKK